MNQQKTCIANNANTNYGDIMSERTKIYIAGATSLPSLVPVSQAFSQLGMEALFVEAPFMRSYISNPDKEIIFTGELPLDAVVVPLTEFWISYCIRTQCCRISFRALKSSRSKKYFYELLEAAGYDAVRSFDRAQALAELDGGRSIVVKPLGLNSGLGIEVIAPQNKDMLDEYVRQALHIQTKNLKLMDITNEGCMLTEYINGTEYSADCFYYQGRISIVRICKKRILIINNKPCTLIYQTVRPTEQVEAHLVQWMNLLFDKTDISFAQFDFIISRDEKMVPIDFASRIGGGMKELMSQADADPYADAVVGACHLYENGVTLTQLNYLPVQKGYIINDSYALAPGYQVVFKHKGDYVTSLPSSIGSRVALVIQKNRTDTLPDGIEQSLLIDGRWIG